MFKLLLLRIDANIKKTNQDDPNLKGWACTNCLSNVSLTGNMFHVFIVDIMFFYLIVISRIAAQLLNNIFL